MVQRILLQVKKRPGTEMLLSRNVHTAHLRNPLDVNFYGQTYYNIQSSSLEGWLTDPQEPVSRALLKLSILGQNLHLCLVVPDSGCLWFLIFHQLMFLTPGFGS